MKKSILLATVTAITLLLIGNQAALAQDRELPAQAGKFIALLSGGDYEAAVEMFDNTMKSALPKEKLKEVWQALEAQCGTFEIQGDIRQNKIQQYDVIYVPCQFEKTTLDGKVVFGQEGLIAGLFFVPAGTE